MFHSWLLVLLAGTALGARLPKIVPETIEFGERIVNGQDVNPRGKWGWQASLQYKPEVTGPNDHTCGNSLLSAQWALTAAHCVYSYPADFYVVILGLHELQNPDSNIQNMTVANVYRHPDFQYEGSIGFPHDVALIKFTAPATVSQYVQFATLSPPGVSHVGEDCYISGWGRLGGSLPLPSILQEANVRVLPHAECVLIWGDTVIWSHHLCILGVGEERGACSGDSGGPLQCNHNGTWTVAGVTSWVRSGCVESWPSVYGSTSYFNGWINCVVDSATDEDVANCPGHPSAYLK